MLSIVLTVPAPAEPIFRPGDRFFPGRPARGVTTTAMNKVSIPVKSPQADAGWTFLTNHAHVLFCIAEDPFVRIRDIALKVGITERAVQRIVADLEDKGYLSIFKEGRRNRYELDLHLPLRHRLEHHCEVASLVDLVLGQETQGGGRA